MSVDTVYSDPASAVDLFLLLPTILLIISIVSAYKKGRFLGLISVIVAYLAGVFISGLDSHLHWSFWVSPLFIGYLAPGQPL